MKTINFLGKSITSKHYTDLSKDECDSIRQELKRKPSTKDVVEELQAFRDGKNSFKQINDYFFRDLRWESRIYDYKWTIAEAIESDDIIKYLVGRIQNNPNTFKNHSLIEAIKFIFRTGGAKVVKMPSNFNPKTCNLVLNSYTKSGEVYVDPCAGWGVRMLTALRNNLHYIGYDVSAPLIKNLKELYNLAKDVGFPGSAELSISQAEVRSLPNDIANFVLTSPPYYNLEDYKFGEQSIKNFSTYESWKNNFLIPTLDNCLSYLKSGGYLAWNIKNMPNYPMLDDSINFLDDRAEMCDSIAYNNPKRKIPNFVINSNEMIMIYKKK